MSRPSSLLTGLSWAVLSLGCQPPDGTAPAGSSDQPVDAAAGDSGLTGGSPGTALGTDPTATSGDTDTPGEATMRFMTGSITTTMASGYVLQQALAGPALDPLDGMDQVFSITHTTLIEVGSCEEACDWIFADGVHVLAHDEDHLEPYGLPGQGAIFSGDQLWFQTIPGHDGHDVYFYFRLDEFGTFDQEGYWDW